MSVVDSVKGLARICDLQSVPGLILSTSVKSAALRCTFQLQLRIRQGECEHGQRYQFGMIVHAQKIAS